MQKQKIKMRERIIDKGKINDINQPKIVTKKMDRWLNKYSKNMDIIHTVETIMSNKNRKIIHIDNITNTFLGNIKTSKNELGWEHNESVMVKLVNTVIIFVNMLLALILSSSKFQLNMSDNQKSLGTQFDQTNSLHKDSLLYSTSNYSIYGLKDLGMKLTPSIVKVSLFLMIKLFVAFQIIVEFKSSTGFNKIVHLCLIFVMIVILEIILKFLKVKLDKILRLNINYVESRAYINEKRDFFKKFFDSKVEKNENVKLKKKLVDLLNSMRIAGNVKKEFILNYFIKNIKNISSDDEEYNIFDKKPSKILSAYRNEDLMKKENGMYKYISRNTGILYVICWLTN